MILAGFANTPELEKNGNPLGDPSFSVGRYSQSACIYRIHSFLRVLSYAEISDRAAVIDFLDRLREKSFPDISPLHKKEFFWLLFFEDNVIVLDVCLEAIAFANFAIEDFEAQRIQQLALDDSF